MSQYDDLVRLGLLNAGDRRNAGLMGLFELGSQIGARSAPRFTPGGPPIDLSRVGRAYQGSLQNSMVQSALVKKLKDQEKFRGLFAPQLVDPNVANSRAQNLVDPIAAIEADTGIFSPDDEPGEIYKRTQEKWMPPALERVKREMAVPDILRGLPENVQRMGPFLHAGAKLGLGREMFKTVGGLIGEQSKYRKPDYHKVLIDGVESYPSTAELEIARRRGAQIRPINRAASNVQVNLPGKANSGFQNYEIKTSNEAQNLSNSAYKALPKLNQIQQLLTDAQTQGWTTGAGGGLIMDVQRIMQTFGWTSEKTDKALASKEHFVAGTTLLILPLVKTLGVNPTDKDLEFVKKGNPELTKTLEGNMLILRGAIISQKREIARAEFDRKFMGENSHLLQTDPIQYRLKRLVAKSNFEKTDPIFKTFSRRPIRSTTGSRLPARLLRGGGR
tara:strand:- start:6685 stop:8019 length:1335 start_codon:yes stop_codon:yes gene_type:complete